MKCVDLAILGADCGLVCLVELKAMYTFDAFSNLTRFSEMTTADELNAGVLMNLVQPACGWKRIG